MEDGMINLKLSDEDSGNSRNNEKKFKMKGSSRYHKTTKTDNFNKKETPHYLKMLGKYEEEQEVVMTKDYERQSTKSFKGSLINTSVVKHAVADLGENSNDYSEDMDESVAFSKVCFSDKEN